MTRFRPYSEKSLRKRNTFSNGPVSTLRPTGIDLAFTQISIFHDGISVSFLIPCGEAEDEILSAAFGDRAESDGTSYRLEPGISRKQVLVPAITDLLSAYPKE